MEALIKASKAFEMTKNAVEEKYDKVIRLINDGILAATENGCNETTVFFDISSTLLEDRVHDALKDAGYHIEFWGLTEVTISWTCPEADEPPTQPMAADENTRPQSILNANNGEDLDDYERECVVKVGYLRDLAYDAIKYGTLAYKGVDNWEGYADAIAEVYERWDAEDMDEVVSKYWEYLVDNGIIRV